MGKNILLTTLYASNLIIYLVVIALWIAIPQDFLFCLIVTLFNIFFTSVIIYADRKRVMSYYKSTYFWSFSQALISVCLVFFLIGILNYWAHKFPFQFDLTQRQSNSLTSQSQNIIAGIEKELTFHVYARTHEFPAYRSLIELYRMIKSNIRIEYVDVELRPDLLQQKGIEQSGTIIIEKGERTITVHEASERGITSALVRLTREHSPVIGLVSDMGVRSWTVAEETSLSYLAGLIHSSDYLIQSIHLYQLEKIDPSIDVLVLWDPITKLEDEEVEIIYRYVSEGGNLILALTPDINGDRQPYLRQMLQNYGLDFRNDLVIDQLKHVSGSSGISPLVEKFDRSSPLERNFQGPLFFPAASSVLFFDQLSAQEMEKLDIYFNLKTSEFPGSWANQDLREVASGTVTFDQNTDVRGPIPMAATVEINHSEQLSSRVVVLGNGTFVVNQYQRFNQNFNFFLNALAWSSHQDNLISLNVPVLSNRRIFIGAPQLGVIFYFSVLFIPLILFGVSFLAYKRRVSL